VSYFATFLLFAATAAGTFLGAAVGEKTVGNMWYAVFAVFSFNIVGSLY
jgi:hypothetical protein